MSGEFSSSRYRSLLAVSHILYHLVQFCCQWLRYHLTLLGVSYSFDTIFDMGSHSFWLDFDTVSYDVDTV